MKTFRNWKDINYIAKTPEIEILCDSSCYRRNYAAQLKPLPFNVVKQELVNQFNSHSTNS